MEDSNDLKAARKAFGARLTELRGAKGLSQRAFARQLEGVDVTVSPQSVSGWERGRFAPDPVTVTKLEDFFDAPGVLHGALGSVPPPEPEPDALDEIRGRLDAIEEHLGLNKPVLRAASAGTDPGEDPVGERRNRPGGED